MIEHEEILKKRKLDEWEKEGSVVDGSQDNADAIVVSLVILH